MVYLCLFITQQIQLAMCRNIVMNHGAEQVKQIQQIQPIKKMLRGLFFAPPSTHPV
jgi:hypothetical protein